MSGRRAKGDLVLKALPSLAGHRSRLKAFERPTLTVFVLDFVDLAGPALTKEALQSEF